MSTENKAQRVFISHSSNETWFVDALRSKLERAGWDTINEDVILRPGYRLADQIERELRRQSLIVVIVSASYVTHTMPRSIWVAAGIGEGRQIFPIVMDGTDAAAHIGPYFSLRFNGRLDDFLPSVVKMLSGSDRAQQPLDWKTALERSRAHAAVPELRELESGAPAAPTVKSLPADFGGDFVGRDDLVSSLHQEAMSKPIRQILVGAGGAGKSRIALEYANRHQNDYDVIWWVRSTAPSRIHEDLAKLAQALGVSDGRQRWDDSVRAVQEWCKQSEGSDKRWLIVFDDAFDADIVSNYLPATGAGHILITTRARMPSTPRGTIISVGSLDASAATGYLLRMTGATDQVSARRLALLLGSWAPSLDQAAALCAVENMGLNAYFDHLESELHGGSPVHRILPRWLRRRVPVAAKEFDSSEERAQRAAVVLNIRWVERWSSSAFKLLQFLSFCDSSAVSFDLLRKIQIDDRSVEELVRVLARFALLTVTADPGVVVHHYVQDVVRSRSTESDMVKTTGDLIRILYREVPEDCGNQSEWQTVSWLAPHVASCLRHFESLSVPDDALLTQERYVLVHRLGRFFQARGDSSTALDMFGKGVTLAHRLADPTTRNGQEWYVLLNDMSTALAQEGNFSQAVKLHAEVLERFRQEGNSAEMGALHLTLSSNLAAALADTGRLNDAATLYEEVLKNYANYMECDNSARSSPAAAPVARQVAVLSACHNLATVREELGDSAGAMALYEAVLRTYSPYPAACAVTAETVEPLIGLSSTLGKTGRTNDALELARRIFDEAEEVLGEFHPSTLASLDEVVLACARAGRYLDAIVHAEYAYYRRKESLGGDHPRTLDALSNLVSLLQNHGETEQASDLLHILVDGAGRTLGKQHPRTVEAIRRLGVVVARTSQISETDHSTESTPARSHGRDERIMRDELFDGLHQSSG